MEEELYKMLLGDNVEQMKLHISDESIDLTVTSPPYDNLRNYKGFSWDCDALIKELYRVTKTGGIVMWNVADGTIDGSESLTSFRQAIKFVETGFKLHDTMIAEKANFSNPSSNRYHQIFEYCFVFSKGKPKTFNPIKDKPIVGMENGPKVGSFGKNTVRQKDGSMKERKQKIITDEYGMRTNIWRYKTRGQEEGFKLKKDNHPAMMSKELARDHIISWSNSGDIVFDPFAGSGTTGVEALQLGRKFVGIELAQEYYDMCIKNCESVMPLASIITG